MTNPTLLYILIGTSIAFLSLSVILYLALSGKEDKLTELQNTLNRLIRSFNDLDEQARLIVKTDLELNKAQEELDKRLGGLNALQRISRQISQALNEEEIFQKLNPLFFEELGFAKVLSATYDENHQLKARLVVNYTAVKASTILAEINKEPLLRELLNEKRAFSSASAPRKVKERIIPVIEAEHFILAPIFTQGGPIGFILVGNRLNAPAVTFGDEEIISILSGQIGQVIENAQLFEKVFRSSQELEIKVKERTKQLASALEKVEEISKKKSDFISAVSHELRTPLTSIKGYAAILMAGKIGEIPDAVKERLGKINTHSDNLVNLINNLLDIARIESGKQELKLASYKAKQLIDAAGDLLTPQLSAKEIKFVTQIPNEEAQVYIDLSQAERVLINLLSNAIKFTPKNGTITVSVSSSLDNGYLTYSVTDTGIGIPPEELKKLFSEFYRVENEINQSVKGTGLGLVLAKNIVLAHGGKMWVTSEVNKGTTFYFTLPASKEAFDNRKVSI